MFVRQWLSEQRRGKYGHYSTLLEELRTEDDALYDELMQRIEGRKDTCDAIKAEFAAEVIQCPTSTEEWSSNAEPFEKKWQFPHCCDALDGKHVAVACP